MASALLIIALVPILKALTGSQVASAVVERRTRSLILAQGRLEKIRAQSVYGYDGSFAEANSAIDGTYLCTVDDSSVSADLRQVTVSVGCDLNDNAILESAEIEVALATLLARRG